MTILQDVKIAVYFIVLLKLRDEDSDALNKAAGLAFLKTTFLASGRPTRSLRSATAKHYTYHYRSRILCKILKDFFILKDDVQTLCSWTGSF